MTIRARLVRAASAIRAGLAEALDIRDVFWIAGLSAVTYGVSQIHESMAWIVCGAVLFWMGVRRL